MPTRIARTSRRKSAPSSPAKTRQSTTSPRQTRTSQRIQSKEPDQVPSTNTRRQQALEPVNEQDDPTNGRYARVLGEPDNDDYEDDESQHSINSTLSEITNAQSLLEMKAVVDSLPNVDLSADAVLKLVANTPAEKLVSELSDANSSKSKRLASFAEWLREDLAPCGEQRLLDLEHFAALFSNERLPYDGPCLTLMKVNLACFILEILNHNTSNNPLTVSQLLRRLIQFDPFPAPFLFVSGSQSSDALLMDESFAQKTLFLGISLMTQLFIQTALELVKDKSFDSQAASEEIFFDEEGLLRNLSLERMFGLDAESYPSAVEQRVREIERLFHSTAKSQSDLDRLRKKYPWRSFLVQAITWAVERAEQLGLSIRREGGPQRNKTTFEKAPPLPAPRAALSKRVRRAREDRAMEEGTLFLKEMDEDLDAADDDSQAQGAALEMGPNYNGRGHSRLRAISPPNRAAVQRSTISESPQPIRSQPTAQKTLEENQEADDEDVDAINDGEEAEDLSHQAPPASTQPTQETMNVLRITQRQQKESNKENSPPRRRYGLLERQPNATTVTFDDDDIIAARSPNKRPREDDSDSEDADDFESDKRQVKRARPQISPPPKQGSRADQRQENVMFFDDNDDVAGPSGNQQSSTEAMGAPPRSSAEEGRRPADESVTSSALPHSSYAGYMEAKRVAKENNRLATLLSSSAGPRATQVRKQWTEEEIVRLVGLMKQYGTSWAKIKEADENMSRSALGARSQVNLKDKARNMKLEYLRAEQELPEFLLNVTIKKADKEELCRRGIAVPQEEVE